MLGQHTLNTLASTQPSVTLSSGEAEFYGVVRAAGAALGQQSLMKDLGKEAMARVWTDSSAAMGISARSGLGKLRHLETHTLWVQEKVRNKAFQLYKVRGEVNPADLFTKHLSSRERVLGLTKLFNCEFQTGRSSAAPRLRAKEVQAEGSFAHELDDHDHDHDPGFECDLLEYNFRDAEIHDIGENVPKDSGCRSGEEQRGLGRQQGGFRGRPAQRGRG